MLRIQGRQVAVGERVGSALYADGARREVNLIQQQAVVHLPLGMPLYGLPLQLKLYDSHRLVHLRHELGGARQARVVLEVFRLKDGARVVAVGLHGEVRQRQQVDAVTFLQRLDVRIANRYAQHCGDEREVACHRAHPLDVVVAPLDVVLAHPRERIHDLARPGSAVEDVAHDM